MAMRRRNPRSLEEAQQRIRNARYQLKLSPRIADWERFDSYVAYRVPQGTLLPKEIVRSMQKGLDAQRQRLSRRVHRWFRRNGRISLVCNLLRRSPVFLRDKWVNDVILERKKIVCGHGNLARREEALRDLRAIAEAILSENLPCGERHRRKKWQPLSAKRPRRTLGKVLEILSRYGQYLEIGTCLLEAKQLTRKERLLAGTSATDPKTLAAHAEMLGVPADWIKAVWAKDRVTAREWTLRQLALEYRSTPAGIRRRLEDADAFLENVLEIVRRRFPDVYPRSQEARGHQEPCASQPRRKPHQGR